MRPSHAGSVAVRRTGYRSGDPEQAEPGEPRPAYDPTLNSRVSDRVKATAAELGMGQTTVWRKLRRYREEQRKRTDRRARRRRA
jgi:hypothetical protein